MSMFPLCRSLLQPTHGMGGQRWGTPLSQHVDEYIFQTQTPPEKLKGEEYSMKKQISE